MQWNIVYLEPVENWLLKLDKNQLKSVAKELRLLELCGNQLRMPHSKSLGAGLFELRERAYGLRIYYVFDKDSVVVLVYAGDKASQERDIVKAREAFKKYKTEV